MLGRGIDQVLRSPVDPVLHEDYVRSAIDYVRLAERAAGPIPRQQPLTALWGDAAGVIHALRPQALVANLETAITRDGIPEPKGINYRMSPENAGELPELGVSCWALANNHVMDWGAEGLGETLRVLAAQNIATAGAGLDLDQASKPATVPLAAGGRVLVLAMACRDSGVPISWAAQPGRPGVNLFARLDDEAVQSCAAAIALSKQPGDIAIASIHWGGNWGYDAPDAHVRFARRLIDEAEIDLVHGHSSHHPKAWEIHGDKLILYGCGDLINDYEGISGYEAFRGDLSALYFADLDAESGRLGGLTIAPFVIRHFRLNRAPAEDARALRDTLTRVCRSGESLRLSSDGLLLLESR